MVLLFFFVCFVCYQALKKSTEWREKKSLGEKWVSIAPASNFEFCTNRYFTYSKLEIKSSLTFVGKPKGKRKNPRGGSVFFTAAAFPFKFRDLCCINSCKFAKGHSQCEKLFFLNIDTVNHQSLARTKV